MRLLNIWLIICLLSCSQKYTETSDSTFLPLLVMKRTACYGTCPQYTVEIYNTGLVKYEGRMFVDKIGCFYTILSSSIINEIKSNILDVNFFEFKNVYDSPITDIPSTILRVNIDGREHEVIDRFKGPLLLKSIHSRIDSIIESVIDWNPCEILE